MLTPILLLAASILPAQGAPTDPARASSEIRKEAQSILDAERAALAKLADRLASSGKKAEANEVRTRIAPDDPEGGPIRFRPLAEVVPGPTGGLANLPANRPSSLPTEARSLRAKTAASLFALAQKAGSKPVRRMALADGLLRTVLERDPDHAEARRLLGYVKYAGGWATPHAKSLLEGGNVLHPKFGWVPADWVAHLDAGELPGEVSSNGKPRAWLKADDANALRRDWSRAWQIKTAPHFVIKSDVPLDEAVAFGRRLEAFHDLFLSQFADVIGADLPLLRRMDSKDQKAVATSKKFNVDYFATKDEYVGFLHDRFGLDERISLGYYMPGKVAKKARAEACSYFYKDDENAIASHATLYHEASHQILFETAGASKYDTNRTNYWIWEGLGTYFETVTPQEDGSLLVGGLVGPRIEQAKLRIENGEYVPLAKFAAMDEKAFRDDAGEAVYRNYAQAMALAVFLLHGEGGRYREPFLDYVADAYRGKVKSTSLADRLGVPFETLDKQFRAFMK